MTKNIILYDLVGQFNQKEAKNALIEALEFVSNVATLSKQIHDEDTPFWYDLDSINMNVREVIDQVRALNPKAIDA